MSNLNLTATAASNHSEVANIAFQVLTIATVGLFSVLTVLHAATQIV
jgi:hypothetical protein